MEKIFVQMKTTKILRVGEYSVLCESKLKDIRVSGVMKENIAFSPSEPLYESEQFPATNQIEPAVIALPVGNVTIEVLTDTVSRFLNKQYKKEDIGFSVGNYFSGDYKNGNNIWNEKSLCVSLTGAVSNREGTIAVAVQIMAEQQLPVILILTETGILEITKEGTSELKPQSKNCIKRIGE